MAKHSGVAGSCAACLIASAGLSERKRGQLRLQVYESSVSFSSVFLSLFCLTDGSFLQQIYLHHAGRRQQLKASPLWNKWDQRDMYYLLCYLRGLAFLPCSLGGFSKSTEPQQTCGEHLIGFGEQGAGAREGFRWY